MSSRKRPPSRSYPGWPSTDDPLGLAQADLDDKPQREAAPRPPRIRPGQQSPVRDGFPACPPERTERTWRITRKFVEAGQEFGVRGISPFYFAREVVAVINRSRPVLDFIAANGQDLAEDIFGRMIRLFWKHYADPGVSRYRAVDLFLDEYWLDLFDQAKTQYTTDLIRQDLAAGSLKVQPKRNYRSLVNDADYQAAQQEIRIRAKLESQPDEEHPVRTQAEIDENLDELLQRLRHVKSNSNPEASSEALSGRVIHRGRSGRANTGGDPRQP